MPGRLITLVFALVLSPAFIFSASAQSVAFSGTPVGLPGRIQAENFDTGRDGVSYHDATPGNTGGMFRQTNVDLETSAAGGFNVGWISAGEWLNYAVSVGSAG